MTIGLITKLAKYANELVGLFDTTGPSKGSATVGRATIALASIADLQVAPRRTDLRFTVAGYYPGSRVGGGSFYWDSTSEAAHNGGGVIQVTGVAVGRFLRVWRGMATPDMYGAYPNDLTKDSAFAFRAALAEHDSVWVPDKRYLMGTYVADAYYGAPAIVLNREGQSLLCGRNARLVCNHTLAAAGGIGINVMFQIANAADCRIGDFKVQPMAAVGTDLNAIDTLQMFNAPGAKIGAIDDTYRISLTSGSIQQSIIARDSARPETSGLVYKDRIEIVGAKLSATLNVKHHHNIKVLRTKVRIDLDSHRPSWMGSDVAPLKFTGGVVNIDNAVAEDCEFTVFRSGGGVVAPGLGYIQIQKATATLSRCVLNVNRIYGGSETEAKYPATPVPKLTTLALLYCDIQANLYFGPSLSIKVVGGNLGSPTKFVQISPLVPANPQALKPELDVSGCEFYCNRALSDNAAIAIDITFSDIDLYFTRDVATPQNCFDIRRTVSTWFHASNIRNHNDSQGLYVVFSGNARFSDVWKKTSSTTELRLESNNAAHPTRVIVDGSFDYKDIYTAGGNLEFTSGIESSSLYTSSAPATPHNKAYARGTMLFNRSASANNGWRSDGTTWVSF